MAQVCPISEQQVNGRACQLNALFTVICLVVFLFTPAKWILLPLAADLLIRAFLNPVFSPFNMASDALLRLWHATPKMTNAGPKLFAAKLAFVFVIIMLLSRLAGYEAVAMFFAACLAFFASLEAAFSFCVACKAYPLVRKVFGSAS
nr:DUF4395 domain-containing protein [uncultured Desulfuromonas sp.]